MNRKKFKTIEEQVKHLIENKNVKESPLIEAILKERPYTTIINPYKKFIAKNKVADSHIYESNISINDYLMLSQVDSFIANKLFQYISIFEHKIKMILAYNISKFMFNGGSEDATSYVGYIKQYLDTKNPDFLKSIGLEDPQYIFTRKGMRIADKKLIKKREDFLNKIYELGSLINAGNNYLTKHYKENHNKIPFWILVHEFSLGDLQSLNNMLTKELKILVYNQYYDQRNKLVSTKKLIQFSGIIESVRKMRNIVYHNESIVNHFDYLNKNIDDKAKYIKAITTLKVCFNESVFTNKINVESINDTLKINDYNKEKIENLNNVLDVIK